MDENGTARDSGELHVIIGAGAIGSGVARALAASDHRVRIITRSGSGPSGPSGSADRAAAPAELGAADASETEATPLAATGRKGTVRARMWLDALAAHQAGRVRAVEVRASDYVGPGAESVLGARVVPNVLRGRAVQVLGRTDRLHTWSFTGDVARMAVVAGRDRRAWGRAWHAPSGPPRTQRDAIDDLARAAGRAPVPVRAVPAVMMRAAGLFSPLMRELAETRYQFAENFVMDSAAARQTFGLEPTPGEQGLAEVPRAYGWQGAEQTKHSNYPA